MDKNLIIKKSTLNDVFSLAHRLRADDVREVIAAGTNPVDALKSGIKNGKECFSVFTTEGLIIGMFGYSVSILPTPVAIVWFLGSDEIEKYPLTLVKEGKKFINKLNEKYTLVNCVYSQNTTHINYLKHLGFYINTNARVINNGEVFYPFYKQKKG